MTPEEREACVGKTITAVQEPGGSGPGEARVIVNMDDGTAIVVKPIYSHSMDGDYSSVQSDYIEPRERTA